MPDGLLCTDSAAIAERSEDHRTKKHGQYSLPQRDSRYLHLAVRWTLDAHNLTTLKLLRPPRRRFPLIARAALALRATSCLIDGEAVACDDDGLPVFDRLRYRRDDRRVFLYAFDLIELNGDDLRREPIEHRKAALAKLMRQAKTGLVSRLRNSYSLSAHRDSVCPWS